MEKYIPILLKDLKTIESNNIMKGKLSAGFDHDAVEKEKLFKIFNTNHNCTYYKKIGEHTISVIKYHDTYYRVTINNELKEVLYSVTDAIDRFFVTINETIKFEIKGRKKMKEITCVSRSNAITKLGDIKEKDFFEYEKELYVKQNTLKDGSINVYSLHGSFIHNFNTDILVTKVNNVKMTYTVGENLDEFKSKIIERINSANKLLDPVNLIRRMLSSLIYDIKHDKI